MTTNAIQIFNFNSNTIRVIERDGDPWWVAKDICDYFGDTNRNRTMQALDEDEKGYTQMTTPGGMQSMAIINEAGLYTMLFAMQPEKGRGVSDEYIAERQEKIKTFKRWITHEVIPAIRKHGGYLTPAKAKEVLLNPDTIIALATELKKAYNERDEAYRVRHMISQKREATACARLGHAYRQIKELQNDLAQLKDDTGDGEHWKKIKSLKWLNKHFHVTKGFRIAFGHYLVKLCTEHKIPIRKVPDADYAEVNAYPALFLEFVHQQIEDDKTILAKYRKDV